jgi:ATP-binding cassette subfamily B protein
MAALTLLPVILIPFINIFLRKKIYDAFIGVQEKLSEMNNFVQETYSGIKIVKAYTGEPLTLKKFEVMCEEFFRKNLKLIIWQGFFHPFMILLTRITTILLVMLAGFIILKQYEGLSTGDFIAFMWIQSYIFFPVLILGWVLPIYQQGRGAYDRLKSIYEEPIKVQSEKEEGAIPPKADIVFNHLTFTYPSQSKPALNDINLRIKGGTKIGITGPSGSGKSTLFKLLSREYEIPRGMIEIGNEDIHDYPLEAFYQEIVSVEQIPFLFSKSIKENVIFGNELASKEELEAATKLADLHETVLEFSEGYETMVGERGVTLSGGQKQRVAIARAFLVNRSILLLDDIFASVDSGTEQRIFQGLFANFQDKTILLTSQRASTLEKMDRILFISGGSIIEDGTPEELLKKDGKFSLLKDLQRLDVRA